VAVDHDESRSLPSQEREFLSVLCGEVLSDDWPVTRERLRRVSRHGGRTAQKARWFAEELIVAVKATWVSAMEIQGHPARQRSRWVLAEPGSLCIEEYYMAFHEVDVRRRGATSRRHRGQEAQGVSS
jgi:hypothetical protein